MTSWAKGTTANSLCSCTDYNLLFKGEEQVEICFIAYHEWIAKPIVVYNSCLSYFSVRCSENYTTTKTKGMEPSVVYSVMYNDSKFNVPWQPEGLEWYINFEELCITDTPWEKPSAGIWKLDDPKLTCTLLYALWQKRELNTGDTS